MRKGFWFALAVVVAFGSTSAMSAIPQVLNYQGILKDGGGVAVGDGNHSVTFKFYDVSSGGVAIWEETQTVTTKAGLFNVLLGSITPVPETVFGNDSWLGTAVENDPEMTPRTKVASVGYAYHALNSDKLQGLGADELIYPSTPGQVFRAYKQIPTNSTMTMFNPTGRVREITGIWVDMGGSVTVTIGGATAMVISNRPEGIMSGLNYWSANGGAPIRVEPNESVEVTADGVGPRSVTITGFEY